MTLNATWQQLLQECDLSQPVNRISAAQIKALGKEPRLMTKFDSRQSRPEVLRQENLFLLPESNGSYLLLREDGYFDLEYPAEASAALFDARFPIRFDSLENASSEMNHLDRLFLCGLIQRFVGTNELWATIRGRKFAPPFQYHVGQLGQFQAKGIQYEVDQGYESADEIVLFEAKGTTPSNFLIRQLFFPFKVFLQQTQKRLRPIFFNFDTTRSLCSFFEFEFTDPAQYQSLQLKRVEHFRVRFPEVAPLSLLDKILCEPLKSSSGTWEIPQADDVGKIMDFPLRLVSGYDNAELIAVAFDFAERQSSYYRKASEQLGLVRSNRGRYELTDVGQNYLSLPADERAIFIIQAMCSQPVIRACLELGARSGELTLAQILAFVETKSAISGETARRRAHSVRSWLRWMQNALGHLEVNGQKIEVF